MTLVLSFAGHLTDGSLADGWLARVQGWLHDSWSHTLMASEIRPGREGRTELTFQLHPAAAEVTVAASGKHTVELTGETSAAGPGYHAHLCELLHTLAEEHAVAWSPGPGGGDSTAFFATSDHRALEVAMVADVQQTIRELIAQVDAVGYRRARLGVGPGYEFEVGDAVVTPLGPRGRDWLERAALDAAVARDVLAWWEPGVGATYRVGRALVEMWLNVRWRRAVAAEETALLTGVLALLESAHGSNPHLDYPWAEWRELHGYLGRPSSLPPRETAGVAPPLGYRRGHVRVALPGGWSLRLPGSFADRLDDDGTYYAWDGSHAIWVSAARTVDGLTPEPPPSMLTTGTALTLDLPGEYRHRVIAYEVREPEPAYKIEAQISLAEQVARVTFVLDSQRDEAWALAVLASLRQESPPS